MSEFWATVAQQIGGGSRTDVLRALVWPNAMLLIALVWGSVKNSPTAVLILIAALLCIFMLLYAAAYIAFGIKDPNLLRSERYNIERMQIEQGILGDSLGGIHDASELDQRRITKDVTPKILGLEND